MWAVSTQPCAWAHWHTAKSPPQGRRLQRGIQGRAWIRPHPIDGATSTTPYKFILGMTYGRILDFGFGGRSDNRYEMALELVLGADFRGVLHHDSSLNRFEGSWGQVGPENGPKPKLKFRFLFPNISPSRYGGCGRPSTGRRC